MMGSVTLEKGKTVIGMAEYIEREALRDALYGADAITMNGVKILNQFPSSDVEPVRHGSIIETIEDGHMKRVFSCCGTDFTKMTCWMTPNFCPECGAKMEGERKDGNIDA